MPRSPSRLALVALATLAGASGAAAPLGARLDARPEPRSDARADASHARPAAASGPAFDVRVLRGRGALARPDGVTTLTPADGTRAQSGAAAFGLGSAGRAEVVWRALGSLRLDGPAEVEWSLRAQSGELELVVGAAASLEVEARRAALFLELAHGWRLEIARSAVQVVPDPHGGWIARHHGGQAVRVRSRVPRERDDWPRVLRPGEEIRLAARERPASDER